MRQLAQRVCNEGRQTPGADLDERSYPSLVETLNQRAETDRFEKVAGSQGADLVGH